jgi:hypothetical protein
MSRTNASIARPALLGAVLVMSVGTLTTSAGERHFRRARRPVMVQPVPTVRRFDPVYGDRQNTFFPTPAVVVQGNYPAGGGYSPLGMFGDQSLSLYGPLSSFRTATAPILTYTRGYDGVVSPVEAITTSYPNLPRLAPVVYPTRANNYYAPRIIDHPGQDSAINWLDQN